MLPRRWLLCGLVFATLPWLTAAGSGDPTTGDANLQETLTFGMRPRTPSDEAFIALVVAKVETKELSLELVVGTYRWALPKKPYPFPYFERLMRARARGVGVEL